MQTDDILHVVQLYRATEAALGRADRDRLRRRAPLMDLTAPDVLGVRGKPTKPDAEGRPCWSYTVTQVRRINRVLTEALEDDARRATGHTPGGPQ